MRRSRGKAARRGLAVGFVCATASLGCPPLSEIGVVTDSAVGGDATIPEASVDASPDRDAHRPLEGGGEGDVAGCTRDAANDPKNCGVCGHDCAGGACVGGVCQPYAILTGLAQPFGVAVRAGIVYFTSSTDDTVQNCVAVDCMNHLTLMTSGQNFPQGIVTDVTNVYWADLGFGGTGSMSGGVATCGLAGCPSGVATTLAHGEFGAADLAVDATSVYWSVQYADVFLSCSVSGCAGAPKTLASVGTEVSGAAVDPTSLYFVEPQAGNVIRCPLGGCVGTPTPLASGQVKPAEVDVDVPSGQLYWSTDGAIMSCPTSGCVGAPTVFAAAQPTARAIAHDETTLYWALYDNVGTVLSCPLSTSGSSCKVPRVVGSMQGLPTRIAVDEKAVYWTNQLSGTLMRVVK